MSKPKMLNQVKDIVFPAPITGVTSNTQETFLLTVPFPGTLPVSSTFQASLTIRTEPNIFTKSQVSLSISPAGVTILIHNLGLHGILLLCLGDGDSRVWSFITTFIVPGTLPRFFSPFGITFSTKPTLFCSTNPFQTGRHIPWFVTL